MQDILTIIMSRVHMLFILNKHKLCKILNRKRYISIVLDFIQLTVKLDC